MCTKTNFNRKQAIIAISCFVIILSVFLLMGVTAIERSNSSKGIIIVDNLENVYTGPTVVGTYILSEKEFEALEGFTSFGTYDDYTSSVNTSFESSGITITAEGANLKLYNLCDKYFNCYYGYDRISPIFPMAISNVETPGRADNTLTWSALFPSRYVDIAKIDNFCVTDVIEDESVYKALSTEYSTRDRGALQMSPTYGTGNNVLNKQMSGTEKNKLKSVDTFKYQTWVSAASGHAGDRFYIPDVCLRLQSAMQSNIANIVRNDYEPKTDMQLIAMLAIAHNTGSGIWHNSNPSKKVGNWYSTEKAYILCERLGSAEFIEHLTSFAENSKVTYIDTKVALSLYNDVFDDSIGDYTKSTTNGTFAIKALYAYVKLSQLYTE